MNPSPSNAAAVSPAVVVVSKQRPPLCYHCLFIPIYKKAPAQVTADAPRFPRRNKPMSKPNPQKAIYLKPNQRRVPGRKCKQWPDG